MKKFIILFCFFIPILSYIFNDDKVNKIENRKYSEVNWEGDLHKFSQNFLKNFEEKFILRQKIIPINFHINYLLGHSKNKDLFIGKDGYIFLTSINNMTLRQRCLIEESQHRFDEMFETLFDFVDFFRSKNINVLYVPIPTQQTIYYDKLPYWHTDKCKINLWDRFLNRFATYGYHDNYLDIRESLIKAGNTYNKYEGHWNYRGLRIGYDQILNKILKRQSNNNYISGGKAEFKWQLLSPFLSDKSEYEKISGSKKLFKKKKNIFIYKDSFGNDFFIQHFQNDFDKIVHINHNEKQPSIEQILSYKPDYIVLPIVERNFFTHNFIRGNLMPMLLNYKNY